MSETKFVHLRVHSDFSLIDGLSKVPPLVKKMAELNMPAMGLTDFTNLCGLVKYYFAAHGAGIYTHTCYFNDRLWLRAKCGASLSLGSERLFG